MTTNNTTNTGNLYSAGDGKILIARASGQAIPANISAGANITITNGTNSISIAASTASVQGASFWVRWTGGGTTITSSYNVASLTNNATGDESVNYTVALADANYGAVASTQVSGSSNTLSMIFTTATGPGASAPTTALSRYTTIATGVGAVNTINTAVGFGT